MLRNNWLSRLCIGLGLICILLAAALGIYNLREDNAARQRSDHVLAALRQEVSSTEHEGFQPVWQLPEESTPQMRTVNIDGYDYIGYLSFPTLDTELPVMSGWSKAGLKIAPGRYYGSVYTGDLVIAGHNYRTGFGKLKLLRQGDPVLFTDMDQITRSYQVEDVEILDPSDVEGMIQSPWQLSLYTCTYNGQLRLAIRCREIESA
ncbi:sortase [Ruminococcus sp.]|uniref:sortase n=1 Tax=Ruminococcus sp. TaxID=41978 RepID=UPI0025DD9E78|nr:sortase [Ruminococcus sp.]MCI5817188.1 sortase [Ruminococcus sp.]MDD7555293.1 sortase [Ruminococcus sp.]MDY4962881.1 sortase [Ruminococcus callidus]